MPILLSPPIAFIILLLIGLSFSYALSLLETSERDQSEESRIVRPGSRASDLIPEYREFYPFAFFFIIMHILVLVIATASVKALTLPLLYVGAGVLSLVIIFRR